MRYYRDPHGYLRLCHRKYGDWFTIKLIPCGDLVCVAEPTAARAVFREVGSVGEAHAFLAPVLGQGLPLLDGEPHASAVRWIAPALTSARMQPWIEEISRLTASEVASWPVGRPFALRPRFEQLAMRVMLRVVFGAGWESIDPENDVGRYTMKVVGLAAGSFLAPESIVVDRAFMTGALAEPHAASVILVHLGDHFAARSTASDLERDEPTASAVAWADDSPFLGSALDASAAIGVLSRAMIGLAVLIPVWALLYVHVLHRQRQIGVMGAIGLSRREVFAIHLMQAALVGVVGVIVGCAVGYALVAWFAHHPIFRSTGFVILPVVSVQSFAVPALLVLGTTLLAGVFPAWRASRLDPARILRGGA